MFSKIKEWFSGSNNSKPNKKVREEINLHNLLVNDTLEYDLSTWIVREVYTYNWDNNFTSREYKLDDGSQLYFLEVNPEENEKSYLSQPLEIEKISPNIKNAITEQKITLNEIVFEGNTYQLKEKNSGKWQKLEAESFSVLTSWDYWFEDKFITIEQWSEYEVEAHAGRVLKSFEIDNLLPAT